MSAPISVRQATIFDLPLLAVLFDEYRQFYGRPPDRARAEQFLRERFAHSESVIFLSFHAPTGRAVGFTQLYPSFSSVALERLYILNDLYVAADARRQGVAHALLRTAEEFARAVGAYKLLLETAATNTPAQALYESLGWRRESSNFWVYARDLE